MQWSPQHLQLPNLKEIKDMLHEKIREQDQKQKCLKEHTPLNELILKKEETPLQTSANQ